MKWYSMSRGHDPDCACVHALCCCYSALGMCCCGVFAIEQRDGWARTVRVGRGAQVVKQPSTASKSDSEGVWGG